MIAQNVAGQFVGHGHVVDLYVHLFVAVVSAGQADGKLLAIVSVFQLTTLGFPGHFVVQRVLAGQGIELVYALNFKAFGIQYQ